ncbi:MAG: segregation/condensation protein A, partial [Deltaproteobacteria bacterium]|nr:segregation/condensation protein A [Deltaproteobacteria bacterium]
MEPNDLAEEPQDQEAALNLKLEAFEGPLDLLLHLIKKNDIYVYDIPIALITQQYLEYLEVMKILNLDIAS